MENISINNQIKEVLRIAGIEQLNEATAYHGSSVLFNRFDMTYLGSGEGAQAHGWGLYFAKSKETAKDYKNKLSKLDVSTINSVTYNGKSYKSGSIYEGILKRLVMYGKTETLSWLRKIKKDKEWLKKYPTAKNLIDKLLKFIKSVSMDNVKSKIDFQVGYLYEVTLPDDKYYLNEEVPYSKQTPYIQDCLNKISENTDIQLQDMQSRKDIYSIIYRKVSPTDYSNYTSNSKGAKKASELLYKYGIKGVRYYGRSDGECYVIFNDKDIKINGVNIDSSAQRKALGDDIQSPEEMYREILEHPEKIKDLKNPPEHLLLDLINENPHNIKYINNPSEKLIEKAIKKDFSSAKYIENLSEENQLKVIKKTGQAIQYIQNPTERVKLEAVEDDCYAIKYIKNPSEELQLLSVNRHGYAIRYIKNPSEEVQLAAVEDDCGSIDYIKNPTERVKLLAVRKNGLTLGYIKNPSEQVQLEAVKEDARAIQYIEYPNEQVQLEAVRKDGYRIHNIIEKGVIPSEQVQLEAVKNNGHAIKYIIDRKITPSEQVQLEAVKEDGSAIKYLIISNLNPSEQLQLISVRYSGYNISYIDNPSEQVQLEAVNTDARAIRFIENPTEKVQLLAINKDINRFKDIMNPTYKVKNLYRKLIRERK